MERSAQVEAISHLQRGLEVLRAMPETPAGLQHELALQVSLGCAWAQAHGWAAPEAGQAYTRVRALCQQLNDSTPLLVVLVGQVMWGVQRAEWQMLHELGEHLLTLAQRQTDPRSPPVGPHDSRDGAALSW